MLEEKIGNKYTTLEKVGKNIGMYVTATVLAAGVGGCNLFEKQEYCKKETDLKCPGEQFVYCSKPEGASQNECECYCRSPSKEPKEPVDKGY